jgi:hypothetical protein
MGAQVCRGVASPGALARRPAGGGTADAPGGPVQLRRDRLDPDLRLREPEPVAAIRRAGWQNDPDGAIASSSAERGPPPAWIVPAAWPPFTFPTVGFLIRPPSRRLCWIGHARLPSACGSCPRTFPNRKTVRTTARRPEILARPIRNLADSRIPWLRALAARQTHAEARRFTQAAPDASFASGPPGPVVLDPRLIGKGLCL